MVCSRKHRHTFTGGPSGSCERAKVIGGPDQRADRAPAVKEVIGAMLDAAINSGGGGGWGRCLQGPHVQCHRGADIGASAGLCHLGQGRADPYCDPAEQTQGIPTGAGQPCWPATVAEPITLLPPAAHAVTGPKRPGGLRRALRSHRSKVLDAAIMLAVMRSAHSLGSKVCHPSQCLQACDHSVTMAAWIEADGHGQRSLCGECRLIEIQDAQSMRRGPSQ